MKETSPGFRGVNDREDYSSTTPVEQQTPLISECIRGYLEAQEGDLEYPVMFNKFKVFVSF
jgi:hypothetical protein